MKVAISIDLQLDHFKHLRIVGADPGVCPDVAAAMAQGALARSPGDVAISITGVAGPNPDDDGNPIGRVCIGLARAGKTRRIEYHYGNR